jgi:hypothetical protein
MEVSMVTHQCFVSHHKANAAQVTKFIDDFSDVFTARAIGVSDVDDFIDSDNTNYVMQRIRDLYLSKSTVTIVLIGSCTWARKYVDWEVASSVRDSSNDKRSGLLAINLPYMGKGGRLPDRVDDNVSRDANGNELGYAHWYVYPKTKAQLRSWIQAAFDRRDTHTPSPARLLRQRNSTCP